MYIQGDIWFSSEDEPDKYDWINQINAALNPEIPDTTSKHNLDQWMIPFDKIHLGKKLGEGNFGDVFRGTLWGTTVAVKKLKWVNREGREGYTMHSYNVEAKSELEAEVQVLATLRHPNTLLYIGTSPRLTWIILLIGLT